MQFNCIKNTLKVNDSCFFFYLNFTLKCYVTLIQCIQLIQYTRKKYLLYSISVIFGTYKFYTLVNFTSRNLYSIQLYASNFIPIYFTRIIDTHAEILRSIKLTSIGSNDFVVYYYFYFIARGIITLTLYILNIITQLKLAKNTNSKKHSQRI